MKLIKKAIFIFLTIIILITIYLFIWYNNFKNKSLAENDFKIAINKGDSFYSLSEKLDISNIFLKIYLDKNKPDFDLKEWVYEVKSWTNLKWLIENLKNNKSLQENITILEWWNIFDIDENLYQKWLIKKWEYIEYVTNPDKIKALWNFFSFIQWLDSLEWYLYPDTYNVKLPFKIKNLVIKQLDNFEIKVYNTILKKYDNSTIKDIINLSSIVEKEERNPKHKAKVAWILKKRLNANWKLWADITACYAYKLTSEECKLSLSKYINKKNDYNTRTKTWLPKTAIWNPNFETIFSTLNDEKTEFWFYLHNIKNWDIYYAKTNEEHEANKIYMR